MLDKQTIFFCHAPQDGPLVRELAGFLEQGCANLETIVSDGEVGPGDSLILKAADGFQADIVVLILSPDAVPGRWVREEWEPTLRDQAQQAGVGIATVLHRDCVFPPLLRRKDFFDLTENRLEELRRLKRWILERRPAARELFFAPLRPSRFAGREQEMEFLCSSLGDRPGVAVVSSASQGYGKTTLALEFAWRRRGDFDGVFWLWCGNQGAARIAGELASQIGLRLEGETESNQSELRRFLSQRRCLVVLDDVQSDATIPLIAREKASILITSDTRDQAVLPTDHFSRLELLPLSEDHSVLLPASRIEATIARVGESAQRLLAAISACAPSGFSLALAAEIAGIQASSADTIAEDLVSHGLAVPLASNPPRYSVHNLVREAVVPGPQEARRHAGAVARHAADPAVTGLADLQHALTWALGEPKEDPNAWSLACTLARRAIALVKVDGRFAEAYELLVTLFQAAECRRDRRVLGDCAWEKIWILEKWDRAAEARELEQYRRVFCEDQMCFDFTCDQPTPA